MASEGFGFINTEHILVGDSRQPPGVPIRQTLFRASCVCLQAVVIVVFRRIANISFRLGNARPSEKGFVHKRCLAFFVFIPFVCSLTYIMQLFSGQQHLGIGGAQHSITEREIRTLFEHTGIGEEEGRCSESIPGGTNNVMAERNWFEQCQFRLRDQAKSMRVLLSVEWNAVINMWKLLLFNNDRSRESCEHARNMASRPSCSS